MKQPTPHNLQGFTLIELMATMVVGLILLTVGGATYLRFQERLDAEKVATELQRFVVQTRAKARSQDAEGCAVPDKVIGYSLLFNPSAQLVQSVGYCGTGKFSATNSTTPVSTYEITVPVDIDFDGIPIVSNGAWADDAEVTFYSLMGGASVIINGATVVDDADIEVSRGGVTYQFTISPGGEISAVTKQP